MAWGRLMADKINRQRVANFLRSQLRQRGRQ
jgi:hypothetical protein